ncbi:MAG: hypothetical protein IJ424_07045 [Oscillospiraceae bacterium]|nr:hypothetical protein [Oscillospiraceae bacterium]
MNPTWWAVWYMWFVMFVVILPAQRHRRKKRAEMIKRKKGIKMTNEWIQKLIGKDISLYGDNYNFKGLVKSVEGNWVLLDTKNGEKFINLDFAYRIDIIPEKNK